MNMEETTSVSNPPAWAEAVLRMVLEPERRENVSGDLLEEYRDRVLPAQGRARADSWYVGQVGGFLWRGMWWWGVLLAVAVIARGALDRFVPPATFYARSVVTTYTAIACFVTAGFWTAWRTRSFAAGVLAGIATSVISAALVEAGSLVMLGIWHDPQTLWAIERSGGLAEDFELPLLMIVPGVFLATLGGAAGKAAASLLRSRVVE
jgi:hypothetical protein